MKKVSAVTPEESSAVATNNQLLSDGLGFSGRLGLVGLGLGGGVRLLQEVMIANRKAEEDAVRKRQMLNLVSLPVKTATQSTPAYASGLNPLGMPLYRDPNNPGATDWFSRLYGHKATSTGGIPWLYPLAGGLAVGGALGGYGVVNSLLNKRRKRDLEEEIDEAKGEFESAMVGGLKTAALTKLSEVYAAKISGAEKKASDWLGGLQGAYGAALLASLGLGTYYGMQQSQKSDPTRLRVELARRRAARRLAMTPVEVELNPVETEEVVKKAESAILTPDYPKSAPKSEAAYYGEEPFAKPYMAHPEYHHPAGVSKPYVNERSGGVWPAVASVKSDPKYDLLYRDITFTEEPGPRRLRLAQEEKEAIKERDESVLKTYLTELNLRNKRDQERAAQQPNLAQRIWSPFGDFIDRNRYAVGATGLGLLGAGGLAAYLISRRRRKKEDEQSTAGVGKAV